jgi:ubiquinone biosynthesis protein COQ9
MGMLTAPEHVPFALSLLHDLIDGILMTSGETSQSSGHLSFYTKRLSLQVIYTTTELYMLTDFSPGHADTWDALGQRLEDAASIRKGLKQAELTLMELRNRAMMYSAKFGQ